MKDDNIAKPRSNIFKIVAIIFIITLISIIFQVKKNYDVRHNWSKTEGVVVKSSSKGWWDEAKQHRYYLEYQYEVNGKKHNDVKLHIQENSLKKYKYLLKDFKKGKPIPVWYNPKNPEESVIITGYLRDAFALMVALSGFIFMLGTMFLRDKLWHKQVNYFEQNVPANYNGSEQLPSSKNFIDNNDLIRINTSMSVFWGFGIPFLSISFLSLAPYLSLDEINPDMSLLYYIATMLVSFICSIIFGILFKIGFKNILEIDVSNKEIREIPIIFSKKRIKTTSFSEIKEIVLYRDTWRSSNNLKNWIMYIHTKSNRSIFFSFRNRDTQPANEFYLKIVKKRLEYLFFKD